MTRSHHVCRHQALAVTGVLIIGEQWRSILESELSGTDISRDGVQTAKRFFDSHFRHHWLTEDMTHVHLVAALLDELDDMEAELRLHNL